jgi:signal transduction histidine kinase
MEQERPPATQRRIRLQSHWAWAVLFVGSAAAALAMSLVYTEASTTRQLGALCLIGVMVAWWWFIGGISLRRVAARPGRLIVLLVGEAILLLVGVALNPNDGYLLMPIIAVAYVAYPIAWSLPAAAIIEGLVGLDSHLLSRPSLSFVIVADWMVPTLIAGSFGAVFVSRLLAQQEELRQRLDELHSAQSRLAALYRQLGERNERERLAARIHETIAQQLIGIVLLARNAEEQSGSSEMGLIREAAAVALEAARALIREGRLPSPTLASLSGEIDLLGERLRGAGIALEVATFEGGELVLDPERLECASMVLREVGSNILRHSKASHVVLEVREEEELVTIVVTDDGVGFDPEAAPSGEHYGLELMRRRVEAVFGDLRIEAAELAGTRVELRLPR